MHAVYGIMDMFFNRTVDNVETREGAESSLNACKSLIQCSNYTECAHTPLASIGKLVPWHFQLDFFLTCNSWKLPQHYCSMKNSPALGFRCYWSGNNNLFIHLSARFYQHLVSHVWFKGPNLKQHLLSSVRSGLCQQKIPSPMFLDFSAHWH